jgi:hypothetical protein
MENLIASVIGTLCAEIITLPICTVKTVYQNNNNLTIKQTINKIYSQSGYNGFIQAYTPAIISQVVSTSSKYYFYELIKSYRNTEKSDLLNNSLNGLVGGVIGSLFSHPVDVWKNYLQRNEKFIFTNHKLYYQGYSASIYKTSVLYASLFPIYDYYNSIIPYKFIPSIMTTLTVSLIIQPFDYYKTIKMAGNTSIKLNTTGLVKPSVFFRGFSLMIARSIPHFAITMGITEYIKFYIKN